MSARGKKPTKAELEQQKINNAFTLRMRIADGVIGVSKIASWAIPLYFVLLMVREIAGKDTGFSVSVVTEISVFVSAASIVAFLSALAKMKRQKDELIRLRNRIATLESQLAAESSEENHGT